MRFIAAHKGSLEYDYGFGDRQRPRMTTENVRQEVASQLSCDNDDWQRLGDDYDSDESANDDNITNQAHA
jgi:hypothetical protein